ncbi:unnamed protein product [Paramecium sonneborni]|uniref:WD40-repeat-containing domain n=1 Tax=Paramecium sonneborni TaxID=65129 RepID=A0A8S1PXH5_9CILI|nr:unnamed protein product [Paramecium sonneborni]
MQTISESNVINEAQKLQIPQIQEKETQMLINSISQNSQQSSIITSNQQNSQPFTYQLIRQHSIKQEQLYYAFAVNIDCSILIAGSYKQIKVFEFIQGILKQIQKLNEHVQYIWTLNFMKRSDQFISGSEDKTIIIWKKNLNNSWDFQQKLIGHKGGIVCLLLNNNEDIIVSGSQDKKIKFWQKQNEWMCSQTITNHTNIVYGLSFNEQQNKLISCAGDSSILIIEQQEQNKSWIVTQKITVEQFGYRLCFIDSNTFTFQPYGKQYINIFQMNTEKYYIKTKDISVKGGQSDNCFFPQQYIKSKCMLVNKRNSIVSLIRNKKNGEFITEESIEFGSQDIFGYMTEDGQYLITWDNKQREIQIRKYLEKQ